MGLHVVNERAPRVMGNMVQIDADVLDIDRRIREGDESGWRGDPNMRLFWNPGSMMFEVVGIDRTGQEYLAASHDRCDHTLLVKLVNGDPRRVNVFAEAAKHNAKLTADNEAADREKRLAVADKMQFAIRKDLGHLNGGRGAVHGYRKGA